MGRVMRKGVVRAKADNQAAAVFTTKNWKYSDKISDICHISAQNIECGYSLEPPRRGGSNEYS